MNVLLRDQIESIDTQLSQLYAQVSSLKRRWLATQSDSGANATNTSSTSSDSTHNVQLAGASQPPPPPSLRASFQQQLRFKPIRSQALVPSTGAARTGANVQTGSKRQKLGANDAHLIKATPTTPTNTTLLTNLDRGSGSCDDMDGIDDAAAVNASTNTWSLPFDVHFVDVSDLSRDDQLQAFLKTLHSAASVAFAVHYEQEVAGKSAKSSKKARSRACMAKQRCGYVPRANVIEEEVLRGIAFCLDATSVIYVSFNIDKTASADQSALIDRLLGGDAASNVSFVTYGLKNALLSLTNVSIVLKDMSRDNLHDVMVAAWLVDPDINVARERPLPALFDHFCADDDAYAALRIDDNHTWPTSHTLLSGRILDARAIQCMVQAVQSLLLWKHVPPLLCDRADAHQVHPHLHSSHLCARHIYDSIERPIVCMLVRAEHGGFTVDVGELQRQRAVTEVQLDRIKRRLSELVGEPFNIDSTVSVQSMLFDGDAPRFVLPTGVKKRSSGKRVLERLDGEIPRLILRYRTLVSILRRDLDSVAKMAREQHGDTMRSPPPVTTVHSRSLQCATPTGRLAYEEPNLQGVANNHVFVRLNVLDDGADEMAWSHSNELEADAAGEDANANAGMMVSARSAFVARRGHMLLCVDYCQLELRVLAHASNDEALRSAFDERHGGDPFRAMAARWYRRERVGDVSDEERARAKQLCYGIMYGKGATALAQDLGTTETEARVELDSFMNVYSGVRQWRHQLLEQCRRDGGRVTTMCGRHRWLRDLFSSSRHAAAHAERQCVNTYCQGSAADIAKLAMIGTARALHEDGVADDTRLLVQLHDELIFETPVGQVERVRALVVHAMQSVLQLRVPLCVRVQSGTSWGDLVED